MPPNKELGRQNQVISHSCCNKLLTNLKQYKFIIYSSVGQRSDVGLTGLKIKVSLGLHFFLEVLGKNSFPCLLPLLEATCVSWLVASFQLQSQQQSFPVSPSFPWENCCLIKYQHLSLGLRLCFSETIAKKKAGDTIFSFCVSKIHTNTCVNIQKVKILEHILIPIVNKHYVLVVILYR